MLYKGKQNTKKMQRETFEIYCMTRPFYKITIIPMVRWDFLGAGFPFNPRVLLTHRIVIPAEILNQIIHSNFIMEDFAFPHVHEVARTAGRSGCRQAPIPGPTEFAISLKVYIDKVTGTCPFCGDAEVEKEYKKAIQS
jgi:hypothetical protein